MKSGMLLSYPGGTIFTGLAREQDLQRQLSLTKNQLRDLRMSHESNQAKLLDHTQRQGESSLVCDLRT